MDKYSIIINKDLCTGCGACVNDCVDSNIEINAGKAFCLGKDCIKCGHCVAVCPKNAVSVTGFDDEIEKIPEINLDPDDVYNMIKFRRTICQFRQDKVEQNIINKIVEAGRITHTASNSQNVGIRVIKDNIQEAEKFAVNIFKGGTKIAAPFIGKLRNKKIEDGFFFFGAPLVIVLLGERSAPFSTVNATLASSNMEFVAETNGLGMLHSGFFTICANISPKLRKMLKISPNQKAVTTLVIGYPKVKYFRSVNRKKGDIYYL